MSNLHDSVERWLVQDGYSITETKTEDNFKIIARAVGIGGDILQPLLPPSPRHPEGRNAYAHIWVCLRKKFGEVRQVPDMHIQEILDYIQYLISNPY